MRRFLLAALVFLAAVPGISQRAYLGFDKNDYPGDDLLPALHRNFSWTGYWLNNPPGMKSNPWEGKRDFIRSAGFGFTILFNGRLDAQLKDKTPPLSAARTPLPPWQLQSARDSRPEPLFFSIRKRAVRYYLNRPGTSAPGSQASIAHPTNQASTVPAFPSHPDHRKFPPLRMSRPVFPLPNSGSGTIAARPRPAASSTILPTPLLIQSTSGFASAMIWQYAQSPRRPEDTAACAQTYAADRGCYPPNLPHSPQTWIDLNVSDSPDPSHGR